MTFDHQVEYRVLNSTIPRRHYQFECQLDQQNIRLSKDNSVQMLKAINEKILKKNTKGLRNLYPKYTLTSKCYSDSCVRRYSSNSDTEEIEQTHYFNVSENFNFKLNAQITLDKLFIMHISKMAIGTFPKARFLSFSTASKKKYLREMLLVIS
ncbi:hypothetical protein BpHYR1_033454 [Brachionus plicatilis]|uniref:Uncharacterized protein n=1 Tax=Brachionus plicatilis TaxID=10195 RepID=A0A3M7PXF0_BRAPC|nr:hypothetical protein BpHYR1_033454 [Brachionus plicatilis]